MRSDARLNRDRLVRAAVELILEVGAEPPLDAIARRADVGIGTLYRHFPDREQLLSGVAHHLLDQSIEAAEAAQARASDGYDAIRQYMHAAVERGVGALNLIHPLLDDPDWTRQRTRMTAFFEAVLKQGKQEGRLRPETRAVDIVFAIIRFSRPVSLGLSRADERSIAHRHLDLYIDGLGTVDPSQHPLSEPPVLRRWTT